jgi:hypothetical protein
MKMRTTHCYGQNIRNFQSCGALQYCAAESVCSVASRPKILKNNSKPAVEKYFLQKKIGGRMTAIFWEKRPKTGRKNLCVKNWFLRGVFALKCEFAQ